MSGPASAGRLHPLDADLAVLSLPLPESLPIPLGLADPAGMTLLTWAFAGLDHPAPRMLLLLAGGSLAGGDALVLATHYGDVPVQPSRAGAPLCADDKALLGRAVLAGLNATLNPALHAHRRALTGLMEATADDLAPEPDAPAVTLGSGTCTIAGGTVPDGLFVRTQGGSALARVARARLDLGPAQSLALDLAYDGPGPEGSPQAVLALHAHAVRPLRLGAP